MKFQIKKFDTLDSTNTYALKNSACLENFTVITAAEQTAGRGRKGRKWISPPGDNLYFSVLIKNPEIELRHISSLPQIMGLSVNEMMKTCNIKNSWIKWPNDVYINEKKVCGILCESRISGTDTALAVGVGVNVNTPKETLHTIDLPATSMICESNDNSPYKSEEILHFILMKFKEEYKNWIDIEKRNSVVEKWRNSSRLLGKQVILKDDNKTIYGTAMDFNENGEIIIQTEKGFETFSYGDLSLRLI